MTSQPADSLDREDRLAAALVACLEAIDNGSPVDRAALAARYPDFASEIARFLDDQEQVECHAAPLRAIVGLRMAEIADYFSVHKELGDFRIMREVGRGGMGIVYEAIQLSLGRRVALKVLPFAATMDPRHLQRFHNEARAAACLDHPHIVKVYAVGCERGVHYFAMKFVEGQALAALIDAQRHSAPHSPRLAGGAFILRQAGGYEAVTQPIAGATTQASPRDAAKVRRIAEWGIQAAEALEHAHSLGIVHRDIKPSNLMIDGAGQLWVTDFGLARTGTDAGLTMTGDVLGTLRYMSPEQALAKHGLVDHRTDIYALGATLYELLTLRPTVDGKDREEILCKLTFEEPPSPRSLNRTIPADLESIVLKALAKEPADRYSTAQEMADELQRYRKGIPLQRTRPIRWSERFWRWCRRNPYLAVLTALSAGLALTLLIGSLVSTWLIAGQRNEIREQYKLTLERECDLRIHLYAGDMKLAWQAWLQGELPRIHELLERHRPQPDEEDLRTFIWYYLRKLTRGIPVARSLDGHRGDVYYLAYSPDGKTLATAGQDGTTRLWDPTTGRQRLVLHGDGTEVNALAFSPDGQTLATATDGRQVHLWDCETGREQGTFRMHQREVATVAFSPDGKTVASGGDDRVIRLWDHASLKEKAVLTPHQGRIDALAFSPDGKSLISGGASFDPFRGAMFHWNLATLLKGEEIADERRVYAVTYSHDGRLVAIGGGRHLLHLRDPISFRLQHAWHGHMDAIQSLVFSPDDRYLVAAGDDGVRVWDVASRSLRQVIPSFRERVWCAAFSPDGRTLATCGRNGAVRLYDFGTAQPHKAFPTKPSRVHGMVAISPDGQIAATPLGNHFIQTWKVATGELGPACIGHRERITGMWFDAHGKTLLTTSYDRTARLWDIATGKQLVPPLPLPAPVGYGALSPDSSIAILIYKGRARFWKTRSGEELEEISLGEGVGLVAFSPEGRTLAGHIRYDNVDLWDLQTHHLQHTLSRSRNIYTLGFSRDGTLLAAGNDEGTIKIWNARSGQELHTLPGHRDRIRCLAISPDGKTLASAADDHAVKLWDLRTGQEVASLEVPRGIIYCLAFTPDGTTLISAAVDEGHGEIYTWLAASADENSPRK